MKRASRLMAAALGAVLLLSVASPLHALEEAEAQTGSVTIDRTLQSELQSYVADLGGTYGVVALSSDEGRLVSINADDIFPSASMYKLLVMYRILQAVENGELSLGDTITITEADTMENTEDEGLWEGTSLSVADALHAMIAYSSNSAAYALTRRVGGWSEVFAVPQQLGMADTYFDEQFWSSPSDMQLFFELLAEGALISGDASEYMTNLLLAQAKNDRLPAILPSDAEVAHKTGELPGVRNDGGIIRGPSGRYVIVVMSSQADPSEAIEAAAEISRRVYEAYGT